MAKNLLISSSKTLHPNTYQQVLQQFKGTVAWNVFFYHFNILYVGYLNKDLYIFLYFRPNQ